MTKKSQSCKSRQKNFWHLLTTALGHRTQLKCKKQNFWQEFIVTDPLSIFMDITLNLLSMWIFFSKNILVNKHLSPTYVIACKKDQVNICVGTRNNYPYQTVRKNTKYFLIKWTYKNATRKSNDRKHNYEKNTVDKETSKKTQDRTKIIKECVNMMMQQ